MFKRILAYVLAASLLMLCWPLAALALDVNDYEVAFSTFNTAAVQSGPRLYPGFKVADQDVLIQAVTTYHWNGGWGQTPGSISIYTSDNELVGSWQATGRSGSGAENVYWDVFPGVVLKAGVQYYFADSDPATWSCNSQSEGRGFVEVRAVAADALPQATPVPSGGENGRIEGENYVFTDRNGTDFRASLNAFATSVVSFVPGDPWTSDEKNMDPQIALGLPDWNEGDGSSSQGDLCLGGGGVLTLGFDVELYDGEGIDLYVFEVGGDVEDTQVEVSPDGYTWYDVGVASGRTAGVDFAAQVPVGMGMRFVRLTDLRAHASGSWPGADIDAVCGIHTRAPSQKAAVSWSGEVLAAEADGLIPDCLAGADLTQPITAAEFSALTVRLFEEIWQTQEIPEKTPYGGVAGHPLQSEIEKAWGLGFLKPIPAEAFQPDGGFSRELMAMMYCNLIKACEFDGVTLDTVDTFFLPYMVKGHFADESEISETARDSVFYLVSNDLMVGVGENRFDPAAPATREQAVEIAERIYTLEAEAY